LQRVHGRADGQGRILGRQPRPPSEATGYGAVYFAAEMLGAKGKTLEGTRSLVFRFGQCGQFTMEKLLQWAARRSPFPDSSGYIFDEAGITRKSWPSSSI
jgi:glutamate dehydrogenase/leucine dehydrogenase